MTTTAPTGREEFDIAIICAITAEYNAVCYIFDEFWDETGDRYGRAIGDMNTYTTGRIGKHNVVVALLPQMGKANAASAASSFRSSYDGLELVLLVGICGGVPAPHGEDGFDILLGDVVISKSVVQYDFGRKYPDRFHRKDTFEDNMSKANKNIRTLLRTLETDRGIELLQTQTAQFLVQLQSKVKGKKRQARAKPAYQYPGTANDRLFEAKYIHKHRSTPCDKCGSSPDAVCDNARHATCEDLGCEESQIVLRQALQEKKETEKSSIEEAQEPLIHIGAVASGDIVMKCGLDRDSIARDTDVIAFEMEGAGVWEEVPCIIIKGVCDYADSHKNKSWQTFAAAAAAAAARALLERYPKRDRVMRRISEQNGVASPVTGSEATPRTGGPVLVPYREPAAMADQKPQTIEEPQRYPGVTFNAPVTGHNVITGMNVNGGGTMTNTFN
ncbi:hypothetical protein PT974_05088 [Cladobotryum mycophilum]|uniref:Nucleoside phosphorylase domain-containing protein n=1 Tax=Cladobotryum mycophilum TaxID=491253 RepID=A0ABR0SRD3_9HYPO